MISIIYWVVAAICLVGLDRITKYFAVTYLMDKGSISLIPNIMEFYYTENDGAAFSSFSGQRALLVILPIIMMVVLLVLLHKTKKKPFVMKATVMMIIAGGIGNLIDRILYGYVVDFISFPFLRFPIFNVADVFVSVGGFILVIYLIFFDKEEKKQ